MNKEQAPLSKKEETKRMMMHFARQYEQKLTNVDQAEERLRRAPPAFAKDAEAMLELALRARQEALEVLQYASDEAAKAGWSEKDRVSLALKAAQQQRASDAGMPRRTSKRTKGAKTSKTTKAAKTAETTRMRSKRRKSVTRKHKRTRRA